MAVMKLALAVEGFRVMPICWAADAANSRVPQMTPPPDQEAAGVSPGGAGRLAAAAVDGVKEMTNRPQHHHSQPAPAGQEGKGRQCCAGALGHKGQTPDQGAEHQQ